MKQHTFVLFDAYGLAVPQHAAVDGERAIANLISVRHALGQRSFHGGLTLLLKLAVASRRREEVHVHVAAAAEGGLELLEREEDFAVVAAGILLRFDVHRANLAAVLPGVEVGAGTVVAVIEAQAGGVRGETYAAFAVRGNPGRTLFSGAVHVGRDLLSMPVQLLGRVGVIEDVDGNRLAFL